MQWGHVLFINIVRGTTSHSYPHKLCLIWTLVFAFLYSPIKEYSSSYKSYNSCLNSSVVFNILPAQYLQPLPCNKSPAYVSNILPHGMCWIFIFSFTPWYFPSILILPLCICSILFSNSSWETNNLSAPCLCIHFGHLLPPLKNASPVIQNSFIHSGILCLNNTFSLQVLYSVKGIYSLFVSLNTFSTKSLFLFFFLQVGQ